MRQARPAEGSFEHSRFEIATSETISSAPSVDALSTSLRSKSLSSSAQYLIGPFLNQGGMASVFLGKRLGSAGFVSQVVLKRLRSELAHVPELHALLQTEAEIQSQLVHPNIVCTTDWVVLDGEHYLVMEYVRGGDLQLLLKRARRRNQRFSISASLFIIRELLQGLAYAHELRDERGNPRHLLHRDISPANVLLSCEGEVKLSDFGIAATTTTHDLLGGLRLRGKIGYMSPEHARQEELDPRADLFSVSTVLYEMLTMKRLFVGQEEESPSRVYATPILPPSLCCDGLPKEMDAVVLAALSLDKRDRPESAQKFYSQLLDLSRRHDLLIDRSELKDELRAKLGDEPDSWRIVEERSGTAQIPSLLECVEVWDDPMGEESMPISFARTEKFVPFKPADALHSEVTAPVPTQMAETQPSSTTSALPHVHPPTRIILKSPLRFADRLPRDLRKLGVFSLLTLLAALLLLWLWR